MKSASRLSSTGSFFLALAFACAISISHAADTPVAWEKLGDPPRSLIGGECAPGMDGAWIYIPEWRGFLLYGGRSPAFSNEGWFFDPDARKWALLWAGDTLGFDKALNKWRALLPREVSWSLDRPGPAMCQGAIYDPEMKSAFIFGGSPALDYHLQGDPRTKRVDFYGATQLGTWTLNPANGKFEPAGDPGPTGNTAAAYDSVNHLVLAAPINDTTWTFSPAGSKWSSVKTPKAPQTRHIVFDSVAKQFIAYDSAGHTWTYDVSSHVWKDLQPAKSPPARRHAGLCFDAARGVTVLHGGVTSERGGYSDFEPAIGGKGFNDTWLYDAGKNEWTELKLTAAPAATLSSRYAFAYDTDRQRCVFCDVAVGVWALGAGGKTAPARSAELPVLAPKDPLKTPPADEKVQAWQKKLQAMPDDSWLDPGVQVPVMGCMNTAYDSKNRCIVQMGGCGGSIFANYGDYGYHNQVWLFDMDVGRFLLRRAHHPWGPETSDFITRRLPAGCSRANCFDSKRGVFWARGGNGQPLLKCPRSIRSYDAATDLFSTAGPYAPTSDGESDQMVYDSKHDLLILADTKGQKETYLYDLEKKSWSDAGPCPRTIADDLFTYANLVYDPEVGAIMICASPKNWQVGEPFPKSPEFAMRTFAFDAGTKKWRDLAPANSEILPLCDIPGVAFDSRNRAVLLIKNDHPDMPNRNPAVPYGSAYILDLATNKWSAVKSGPAGKLNQGAVAYDSNHNVFICDFGFRPTMMLYRYKGGCPDDAFTHK